ncbi:MAG: hypothetical protein ACFBSF_13480 [Leptolyngbyaceae cyanobacterium]
MRYFIAALAIASNIAFWVPSQAKADNILYLNSTRGAGTGSLGNFRSAIADSLDDYGDGSIFDVDFVQTHVAGDLASFLNAQPIDYYDQIWFDTTIRDTAVLNDADLAALNTWAANDQPEFILDSSFFFRNKTGFTLTASAEAVTFNEALALQSIGGGILIGTDHNQFTDTANQILTNFGFDTLFTGVSLITADGSFVGDLLLQPESVGDDFFTNNLEDLTTSHIPVGEHTLNANGGDRTITISENLYSLSPDKVVHIGASFDTGSSETPLIPDDMESVPEPTALAGLILTAIAFAISTKHPQHTV